VWTLHAGGVVLDDGSGLCFGSVSGWFNIHHVQLLPAWKLGRRTTLLTIGINIPLSSIVGIVLNLLNHESWNLLSPYKILHRLEVGARLLGGKVRVVQGPAKTNK
jgi:hypothetical protein